MNLLLPQHVNYKNTLAKHGKVINDSAPGAFLDHGPDAHNTLVPLSLIFGENLTKYVF